MKREWIVISLIIFCFMIASCGGKKEAVEKPIAIQGVKIETINLSPVEEDYEAVGTVRSKTTSILSSKTVGHILAIYVREGDRVRKGQLLIELDDRDSRAQLQKVQAGLREAQESLKEIDQNSRAAESGRDAAEAGKSLALATFTRYKALLDEKSVSLQEFDEVQAKLKIAEAELERAKSMLQALMAKKNQVLARIDQVKADITSAQTYVDYSRILSPIDGIVTSKQAEVGLLASPGVPLLTVEDDSRYRLEVSVEDSLLEKIRAATPVGISFDALGARRFSSSVAEIVPASDPGSRSFTVKIDLFDKKGKSFVPSVLRSGLFGKAYFPIGKKEILKVPQTAIIQREQLVTVFVADASNTLHLRLIKIGRQYGDRVEVLSGLNEGDRVVVMGVEKLKEGDKVS
jgi:multidrug efflux system membrane fusion protein